MEPSRQFADTKITLGTANHNFYITPSVSDNSCDHPIDHQTKLRVSKTLKYFQKQRNNKSPASSVGLPQVPANPSYLPSWPSQYSAPNCSLGRHRDRWSGLWWNGNSAAWLANYKPKCERIIFEGEHCGCDKAQLCMGYQFERPPCKLNHHNPK